MEYNSSTLIAVVLLVITTYLLYLTWLRMKYPPGPWPLPIIGNLHLLTRLPQYGFTSLATYYGPIYTFWMGSKPTVVICSTDGIKEVVLEKGKEFAGRDLSSLPLQRLFNNNEDTFTRTYDEKHKVMRKLLQSIMNPKTNGGTYIERIVEEEMRHLVEFIKSRNGRLEDPHALINFPISNIIVRTLFSFRFQNTDDPSFQEWIVMNNNFLSALGSAALFDAFPILWYIIPKFRKSVNSAATVYDRFIDSHLTKHEETYKEGTVRDLTDAIITSQKYQMDNSSSPEQLTRLHVSALMKNLLVAGIDTTTATIHWALLVLLHQPDIQDRLHQELDEYFWKQKRNQSDSDTDSGNADEQDGSVWLFTVADRPHLHYVNAFIYETLRRCPIAPLAAPHKTLTDTSVGGLKIPKDTSVMLNIFAAHMDEKVWEKPSEFTPERFLNSEGHFDSSKAKNVLTFGGGGPRKCAGEYLARTELFDFLTNVLHKFDLSCPSKADLPSIDDGVFQIEYTPLPFKMYFNFRAGLL